jgi:hypothetical protein
MTATKSLASLLVASGPVSGYFAAEAKLGFGLVNSVLEQFEALKSRELAFQGEFAWRVHRAIETEFRMTEVTVSMLVPREMEGKARLFLAGLREMVESQFESAVPLPTLPPPAEAIRKQSSEPEIGSVALRPGKCAHPAHPTRHPSPRNAVPPGARDPRARCGGSGRSHSPRTDRPHEPQLSGGGNSTRLDLPAATAGSPLG